MMHLWATGKVPYYADFWSNPIVSVGGLLFVTYWCAINCHLISASLCVGTQLVSALSSPLTLCVRREFHFYWVHRAMHPWWNLKGGLANGDIGAFLYRMRFYQTITPSSPTSY